MTFIDSQHRLDPVGLQMLIEEKLLVEERGDHSDRLRVHLALSEILYDHSTEGGLNEILIFEPLPLLKVQVAHNLIAF